MTLDNISVCLSYEAKKAILFYSSSLAKVQLFEAAMKFLVPQ